ncbi:hypothetical protein RFL32_12170, partial [Streptococcus suis]
VNRKRFQSRQDFGTFFNTLCYWAVTIGRLRNNCGYQKQFYYAKRAQLDYEAKLSDSRTGVALNKEEFYRMDEIVSAAIQKGQHLNHIIASN